MMHTDIFIVGAGIAGITAAKTAAEAGLRVLIADREAGFGGVLRQCMHKGFGNNMSGPDYISELCKDFPESVSLCFSTTVLEVREDKTAILSSREKGIFELSFSHMILATGCMEISPGMLPIGGTRPLGVYTAGQAQLMSFMDERFPSPVVILGSGDLGLIMAKQLHEQGHEISCIIEKNPAPTAMARNRDILEKIPLITQSTISEIHGESHIEAITLLELDSGKEQRIDCKTLLIAAGLKPDRGLVRNLADRDWITLCGNCFRIYPMVEGLAADAKEAAKAACERNRYT